MEQTVLEMERYLKDEPKVVRMYSVDIHSIPAEAIFKELKAVQSVQTVLQMEELLEEKFPKLTRRIHK